MTDTTWFEANLRAIEARLALVKSLPDGVLYHDPESENDILVHKDNGVVYLYFHALLDAEIQSRMELDRPLYLLSPYSQMVMVSLLWNAAPKRINIIGFGGGRLPMVMHHVLPQALIDCAEIDHEVVNVATRFFGVAEDARLRVTVQDGRKTLQEHAAGEPYDIIVVDAFIGIGSGPRAFATCEFFALCRERLTPDGVVVINLLDNDPASVQKRYTIAHSFPKVLRLYDAERGNQVLFGCNDANMTPEILQERARVGAAQFALGFSLEALTDALQVLPGFVAGFSAERVALLHDEGIAAPLKAQPKLGRNDLCFCGSGKKFKKCCG